LAAIKKWNVPRENPELAKILAQECQINEFVASILVNRGQKSFQEAQQFIEADELAPPFELRDMEKATNRIKTAINDGETIAIYGDYDCDGVTATSILYIYLNSIGADVMYYIPERDGEGYGMNKTAIKSLSEKQVTLIITVDNGISAVDEVDYANMLGIDVVITDHHQPSETLPPAFAIVNAHQKNCPSVFKGLCGAGVAFKLVAALEDSDYQTALESFADIAAIGTIGDIVPLKSENRALVKYGLEMLKMSENIGLNALIEVCGLDKNNLTAQTIAFTIVPRINAAGRMGSASLAVELLLCEDYDHAVELANKLDQLNTQRKTDEAQIMQDVEIEIAKDKNLLNQRVIMLYNKDWNHGIIGIVCSKLIERYGKPCMLMTSDDGILKGSARSLGEFHLFKALSANANHLLQYGGHKLAAGFSLEEKEFDNFTKSIEKYAQKNFDLMPQNSITIDKILNESQITIENIQSLDTLKPFGASNELPIFLIRNAVINQVTPISNDKHQRLNIKLGDTNLTALYFGQTSEQFFYKAGDTVDIIVNADINEYNKTISVSLKIKDIRPSGFEQRKFFAAKGYYEKIIKNEQVAQNIIAISVPTREEIGKIYKYLKASDGYNGDIESLYIKINSNNLNYCKMRVIIDILDEIGVISLSPTQDNIKLNDKKADLNSSLLYNKLNELSK